MKKTLILILTVLIVLPILPVKVSAENITVKEIISGIEGNNFLHYGEGMYAVRKNGKYGYKRAD